MNKFTAVIWTILGILAFIAVVKFFIWILPFILIIALVGYLVLKGKKFFRKNNKKENNGTYTSYNNNQDAYETSGIDDNYDGKVIDVDYKEVDK